MSTFEVEITETYPGSQHCYVGIYVGGYGAPAPRFQLICLDELPEWLREEIYLHLDESNGGTFRPEYAQAIKKGLESSDAW